MPRFDVVGRLVVRRRPSLVVAGPAVQAGMSEAPAARSRFPGRLTRARGPAELDPAGAEVVTERADCRLVLEHRCGHGVRRARVPCGSHADLVPARGTARQGKELARHAVDHPHGPRSRRCSRCRRTGRASGGRPLSTAVATASSRVSRLRGSCCLPVPASRCGQGWVPLDAVLPALRLSGPRCHAGIRAAE